MKNAASCFTMYGSAEYLKRLSTLAKINITGIRSMVTLESDLSQVFPPSPGNTHSLINPGHLDVIKTILLLTYPHAG